MKPEALGFGMMRLPVLDGEPTNIDYKTLNSMVDTSAFCSERGSSGRADFCGAALQAGR